jgi:hypothetical protein
MTSLRVATPHTGLITFQPHKKRYERRKRPNACIHKGAAHFFMENVPLKSAKNAIAANESVIQLTLKSKSRERENLPFLLIAL